MTPLPAARPQGRQEKLWPWVGDRPLDTTAAVRTVTGDFYEECTAVLTRAKRLRTDGRSEICPDLAHDERSFLEVKSLSQKNGLYLYDHRMQKDQQLVSERWASLAYVLWVHSAPATTAGRLHALHQMLASHIIEVLVIPFDRLHRAARRLPVSRLQYSGAVKEKVPARRVPYRMLRDLAHRGPVLRRRVGRVYDVQVGGVEIHGPDLGMFFPPLTEEEREAAHRMAAELATEHHRIGLAPAPNPRHSTHQIRVVEGRNPWWYRRFCRLYRKKRVHGRRPWGRPEEDTDIRRYLTLPALDRLSRGVCRFEYDWRLRPFVEEYAHKYLSEKAQ